MMYHSNGARPGSRSGIAVRNSPAAQAAGFLFMDDDALKIGARHSRSDMEIGRSAKRKAREIVDDLERLGFSDEPELPAGEIVVSVGSEAKALGDGRIGGYLVRFSTAEDPDLDNDYFTPDTDFGEHARSPVYYNHGRDPELGKRKLASGELRKDSIGIWIETQLALRDEYERAIYELAKAGKLGWSSGTAPHLVEREKTGRAWRIVRWPLGLDASLTPTPAEPRAEAIPLKSIIATLATAGEPEPDGSTKTAMKDVTQNVKEKVTMTDNLAQAQATNTLELAELTKTLEALTKSVASIAEEVKALKTEPPKPSGIAEIVASGEAPAVKTTPKEDYATEQLNALKSLLKREIGPKEWEQHTRRIGQIPEQRAAADAFRDLIYHPFEPAYQQRFDSAMKATLRTSVGSLGGNIVPTEYANRVIGTLTEQSILRLAGAYQFPVANAGQFALPTVTRSGSAPLTAELGSLTQTEPTFERVTFTPYKYTALYIASIEQVADTNVPLEQVLLDNAAWQFVQSENNHFGAGTGTGQPQGVNQATTAVSAGSTLALLDENDVIDLYHAVPYQYRSNAVWFAHDQVIRRIRQLRENGTSGQFLWQPGLQAGQPDRLLGRPIYTLNSMASSGSTSNVLVFGDPRFYWIADFNNAGIDFRVLNELYAASGAVGWWFVRRFDGRIIIGEAFRGARLV